MTALLSPDTFHPVLQTLTERLAGQPLNAALAKWLNAECGPGSPAYEALAMHCRVGVRDRWLCQREAGGIRYGRIYQPHGGLYGFSVDVVDMANVLGPRHRHPNGEIDMVVPMNDTALFDGHGAGWVVYPPDSTHMPTVSGGRALVMYLLPQGEIDFMRGTA